MAVATATVMLSLGMALPASADATGVSAVKITVQVGFLSITVQPAPEISGPGPTA